jgi:N-acetylneuraminate lyase
MNTQAGLHGIVVAAVTPFDEQERFAAGPFEALLERLYSAGSDGVYVCGQTGEGLLQPVEQRKRVAETALRCSPTGKQVIIHVGAYRTADAVELARHAGKIGATAVSSLPPIGPYSFEEIRSYYEAVAAASDLPVLVYFFPAVCPSITNTEQIEELCAIPNVVGLKFTSFDLYKMRTLKRSGVVIFNGQDEVLAPGLLMGADGGIGTFYNVVPELFVKLRDCARKADWEGAVAAQDQINDLIRFTLRFPCFPAVKLMLKWTGIDCGPCLAPRRTLNSAEVQQFRDGLGKIGFEHLAGTVKL